MISHMDVDIDNARLDRYYSNPIYVGKFNGKVYIILKRNSTSEQLTEVERYHEGFCAEYDGLPGAVS